MTESGATTRRQHYVPRLYLRAFQSATRRIHAFNLKRSQPLEHVSLRDQCYKHKFYGADGRLDNLIRDIEPTMAQALACIRTRRQLPEPTSVNHWIVSLFVALQSSRTLKYIDLSHSRATKMGDSMRDFADRIGRPIDQTAIDQMVGDDNRPNFDVLSGTLIMHEALTDLKAHLVVSEENGFFTSDNPVLKYNQYCEGFTESGITGAWMKGLQLFVPLSPDLYLIFYDSSTYKIPSKDTVLGKTKARRHDVDVLNVTQLVAAQNNLYFPNWSMRRYIRRLISKHGGLRISDPQVIREFVSEDEEYSSMFQTYERTPDLSLDLSFIQIRRRALKMPLSDRWRLTREPYKDRRRPVGSPHRTRKVKRRYRRRR